MGFEFLLDALGRVGGIVSDKVSQMDEAVFADDLGELDAQPLIGRAHDTALDLDDDARISASQIQTQFATASRGQRMGAINEESGMM